MINFGGLNFFCCYALSKWIQNLRVLLCFKRNAKRLYIFTINYYDKSDRNNCDECLL